MRPRACRIAAFGLLLAAAAAAAGGGQSIREGGLSPDQERRVDALVQAKLEAYHLINVGLIKDGRIVLTKAYGRGAIDGEYQYGSVSKPVTSTIILKLRAEGRIRSLDDPVWAYVPRFREAMPDAFRGAPLTLKHLLTHTSGIPHNDEPPLREDTFNLKFKPGARSLYSTPGYGILGLVIEAVTGLSYSDAVRTVIGEPVGGRSFKAWPSFIAPGAFVTSTIRDMALFAIGMMTGVYIPTDVLSGEAWQPIADGYGYGWSVRDTSGPDPAVFHGGSNGLPHAYLLMKPRSRRGVVLFGEAKSFGRYEMNALASSLMELLADGACPGGVPAYSAILKYL